MIKNVVFDMGGVLIGFDRNYLLDKLNVSKEDRKQLFDNVLNSVEWSMLDRGSIDENEALERMKNNLPDHLHEEAETLVLKWDRLTYFIDGMEDLIKELDDNGYDIYLLSNATRRINEYWGNIPGNKYFKKRIVSAFYGLVKPQDEIYQLYNSEVGLNLEECVFIDDTAANIEGAIHNGMKGIVFNGDVRKLRNSLSALGVNVKKA